MIPARRALLALTLFSVVPALAHAEDMRFVGTWHWSKTESTTIPGEPLPRDITLSIAEAVSGKLKWTVTEIDPGGGKHVESFDGAPDGKPRPLQGGDGQTTAAFTMTEGAISAVFTAPDGGSDSWSCTISSDGRKMTCKGAESDGKGHSQPYADVYDRT